MATKFAMKLTRLLFSSSQSTTSTRCILLNEEFVAPEVFLVREELDDYVMLKFSRGLRC